VGRWGMESSDLTILEFAPYFWRVSPVTVTHE
jgi:hypothetical protein